MFDEGICCCPICGNILPVFGECPVCKMQKEIMIDEMFREWKKEKSKQ